MKVLWLDPLNTNAQFLNLMSIILREAGHEVHVRSNARTAFAPSPDVRWTNFTSLHEPRLSWRSNKFAAARLMATYHFDWLRAFRYARTIGVGSLLVSTNLLLWRSDRWAMRAALGQRIAPVLVVHRPWQQWRDNSHSKRRAGRYRAFYESVARILTLSTHVRESMRNMYRLPEERLIHLPYPRFHPLLDRFSTCRESADRLRRWTGGAPVIAFLSNLHPDHGYEDLLSSLPTIDARLADWRLLVISSALDKAKIGEFEARLARLGFRERAWCWWAPYSYPVLKAGLEAASLVVAPYRHGTQSGVLAQALDAGLPIVATDVGGLPEMVRPGVNGELVPARNPPRLAEAVIEVVGRLEHYRFGARDCQERLSSPCETAAKVVGALQTVAGTVR